MFAPLLAAANCDPTKFEIPQAVRHHAAPEPAPFLRDWRALLSRVPACSSRGLDSIRAHPRALPRHAPSDQLGPDPVAQAHRHSSSRKLTGKVCGAWERPNTLSEIAAGQRPPNFASGAQISFNTQFGSTVIGSTRPSTASPATRSARAMSGRRWSRSRSTTRRSRTASPRDGSSATCC